MKKCTKFLIAALTLSAVIFAGCKNGFSPVTDATYKGTDKTDVSYKTVTLTVTGDPEYVSFPVAEDDNVDGSRTIVADSLTATSLKYYLHYTNVKTGDTIYGKDPITLTAPDATTPNVGTVPLTLEDGNYEFTLYALQTAPTGTQALDGTSGDVTKLAGLATLIGKTSADLRSSTERVHFYMSPDGLAGTSLVELKAYSNGWDIAADYPGYTCTWSLINKASGSTVVNGQSLTLPSTAPTSSTTANIKPAQAVPAGTYSLVLTFKGKARTYEWSDLMVVLPNNKIEKDLPISDVIEKLPTKPANLYVAFKDTDNIDEDYYNVAFQWEDKSNNESYFQLEFAQVGSDADPFGDPAASPAVPATIKATSTAWGDITKADSYLQDGLKCPQASILKYGKDFYGKQNIWVSGSLLKNNTEAVFKIKLGERYVARIAAVNDSGASEYAYMDFSGVITKTGYNQFDSTNELTINRYRVSYYLNGGTRTNADDSSFSENVMTEYRTQNNQANAGQGTWSGAAPYTPTAGTYVAGKITSSVDVPSADIWNPACDTTTYKALTRSSNPWTYWKKESITGIPYNYTTTPSTMPDNYQPEDYKGYKNLKLFACYNAGKADVTVYDPNVHNITASNVTVTGNGVTDDINSNNSVTFDLNAASAGTLDWVVAYTTDQDDQGITWDKVNMKIRRQGTAYDLYDSDMTVATTSFTATTDLSTYSTGKYAITFSAYNSSSQLSNITRPYTYTVYLSIIEGTGATITRTVTFAGVTNGTVTAEYNDGTVKALTSGGTVPNGTVVTFKYTPTGDYAISSWGAATPTSLTKATVTVTSNLTLSFADTAAYAVNYSGNRIASATVKVGTTDIAISSGDKVADGSAVTFTAAGGSTYKWTGTTNAATATGTSDTATVSSAALTASAKATAKITFSASSTNGAGTPAVTAKVGATPISSGEYIEEGSTIDFTATSTDVITSCAWTGTDDDTATTATNTLTVGASDTAVTVDISK